MPAGYATDKPCFDSQRKSDLLRSELVFVVPGFPWQSGSN